MLLVFQNRSNSKESICILIVCANFQPRKELFAKAQAAASSSRGKKSVRPSPTPFPEKKVIKAELESDDDVPLSVRAATLTKKRKRSESDDEDYKLEVISPKKFLYTETWMLRNCRKLICSVNYRKKKRKGKVQVIERRLQLLQILRKFV